MRTATDDLAVELDGGVLALLCWVDGEPLTGATPAEQRAIGATLAHAHRAGDLAPRAAPFFATEMADPGLEHLSVEPWVRPAVVAAADRYRALPPVTWGTLHTDPAPEAFLASGDRIGVIDWTGATPGPLLYDLASAAMYVGGIDRAADLISAYTEVGATPEDEIRCYLNVFADLRWAVQASYFARRVVEDDRTGIASAAENLKGLRDARDALG